MDFKIYLNDVKAAVKRQLSIIGKHHSTQKGDTLFSVSTLTSVEESVMQQFIVDGAQHLVANLAPVLSSYTLGDLDGQSAQASDASSILPSASPLIVPYLTFSVRTTRTNKALSDAAMQGVLALLVAYVTHSVLSMVLPDLAPKYANDVQSQLQATSQLVFNKLPPTIPTSTLADCKSISDPLTEPTPDPSPSPPTDPTTTTQ